MSLKYEQYNSLKYTKEFLYKLLDTKQTKVPKPIREEAARCLKHFPFLKENGEPIFSNDNFNQEKNDKTRS